jgi:hypothetical protein
MAATSLTSTATSLPRLTDTALVGTTDGSFLVRQRLKKGGGAFDNEFILTVVFKASPPTTVFNEALLQSCQPSCPLSKTVALGRTVRRWE